jgi:N-acetylmuramic acid 6-phosphate etherase
MAKSARGVRTEQANRAAAGLDTKSTLEIVRLMNREDAKVVRAIRRALPQIVDAIERIAIALEHGGRLIYVGTGTSGRIGALDASECPPTFSSRPRMVQYLIAGGTRALGEATEANEDSPELGLRDIAAKRPSRKDVVIALSASGRTPYTLAALECARKKGAATVGVTSNPGSPLARAAEIAIVVDVGPEVVAGSTRLKAGTAQKMVTNMLTTGAFAKLGYIYGNLMVNVHLKNSKLRERGVGILEKAAGIDRAAAEQVLAEAGSVQVALVMLKTRLSVAQAKHRLKQAGGNVRQAIAGRGSKKDASASDL